MIKLAGDTELFRITGRKELQEKFSHETYDWVQNIRDVFVDKSQVMCMEKKIRVQTQWHPLFLFRKAIEIIIRHIFIALKSIR